MGTALSRVRGVKVLVIGDKRDEPVVVSVAKSCGTTGRITGVSENFVVSSCSQTCSVTQKSSFRFVVWWRSPVRVSDEVQHSPKSELSKSSVSSALQIYCTAANADGKATFAITAINAVTARMRYICFSLGKTDESNVIYIEKLNKIIKKIVFSSKNYLGGLVRWINPVIILVFGY